MFSPFHCLFASFFTFLFRIPNALPGRDIVDHASFQEGENPGEEPPNKKPRLEESPFGSSVPPVPSVFRPPLLPGAPGAMGLPQPGMPMFVVRILFFLTKNESFLLRMVPRPFGPGGMPLHPGMPGMPPFGPPTGMMPPMGHHGMPPLPGMSPFGPPVGMPPHLMGIPGPSSHAPGTSSKVN